MLIRNRNARIQQYTSSGSLQVNVSRRQETRPVENARVEISYTGDPGSTIDVVQTDESGQILIPELNAPPIEYSMEPGEQQPYAQYTLQVEAEGFQPIDISGVELFPGQTSIQQVRLEETGVVDTQPDNIVIPANTLYGDYPPKISEAEIKPVTESGEIVLSRVVIPEYIVVHNGAPSDSTAANYYVTYTDYIKNVASSEIYATWPDAMLRANILAIMSFTLNRVYTEWYRNKGYDFTVTTSTAYDQKWSYGRTIFDSISRVVDEMFSNYLSRPNVKQPILSQYCDGRQVSCPNWLSQWGSKYLGDDGLSAIEILRYYYGNSMFINTADQISRIPASWPGENLETGSTGSKVTQLQEQLNAISNNYPAINKVTVDGIYGSQTRDAVRTFQSIFGLPQTGVVDYKTWYQISQIYVGVTRIAELN